MASKISIVFQVTIALLLNISTHGVASRQLSRVGVLYGVIDVIPRKACVISRAIYYILAKKRTIFQHQGSSGLSNQSQSTGIRRIKLLGGNAPLHKANAIFGSFRGV